MSDQTPKRTPLHGLHLSLGARMAPFAGWDMPIQYPAGVMKEHLATRAGAGLFDVSHMGQAALRPRSGRVEDAAAALERLVPVNVVGLAEGRQRYALFTNEAGGIIDDLMVANRGDHLFVVVNAANKDRDIALLRDGVSDACELDVLDDRALIAVQGPKAEAALAALGGDAAAMRFMDVADLALGGAACVVSRSGYTGEDGFEISVPADAAEALARALLAQDGVEPVGLGARDSLRLEAGLCLHGNDIDESTTPAEAALGWAIQKIRRRGGAREGGFPGAERVLAELESGPARLRVGLSPQGRAPMRAHTPLFAAEEGGEAVGEITSGGFGPSFGAPVAMGYVPAALAAVGTALFGEVRGRRLPVSVAALPFVPNTFKR